MRQTNVGLGDSLERYFHKCLSVKNWDCVRIPDGCKQISSRKIIRVKSPFDFFATKQGAKSFFCDVKTIQGDHYCFSAINQLQVRELLKIERNGNVAGYVVHFRESDTYGFLSASQLSSVRAGGSISSAQSIALGKEIEIDRLFKDVE